MKYFVETYGCQMNERDSETLAGLLEDHGLEPAEAIEHADLILLNTCCVRETAEERIFGRTGQLKKLKYKNPDLILGICGCMAQEEETIRRIRQRMPHVDLVFGTHNLHTLPDLLDRARAEDEMVVDVWRSEGAVVEHLPARRAAGVSAWVTIIYGCDHFCSYCIVPYVRGRERSRQPEEILAEVEGLAGDGFLEVTLLGQNVNSYGKDLEDSYGFAGLLRAVDRVPGIERIRFMTSHPMDFHQGIIDAVAGSRHVCEHFHLPVQAGSDDVLRRMNRRYTRDSYLDLIGRVRAAVPEASITTDIIVGFPGETEEDFALTLDLVERARFDNAYTFVYSPRSGTPAARWEDPTPPEVKKERLQRLMDLQYAIGLEQNRRLVGSQVEVLVEGPSKKDPGVLSSRTRTNKLVLFPGSEALRGRLLTVEITDAHTWTLSGRLAANGGSVTRV